MLKSIKIRKAGKNGEHTRMAVAMVLTISYTDEKCSQAIVQVQVIPPQEQNYVTETRVSIPPKAYSNLFPGKKIFVKYNSSSPRDVTLLQHPYSMR